LQEHQRWLLPDLRRIFDKHPCGPYLNPNEWLASG
jgi:hypothetical protein